MKILVVGGNGMLGHMMRSVLEKNGHDVWFTTRYDCKDKNHFRLEVNDFLKKTTLENYYNLTTFDYVINCIGAIKQRIDDLRTYVTVNTTFPQKLSEACNRFQSAPVKMIHVTTDCVYSGDKGDYVESDDSDCVDMYGTSKSLGEPVDCLVLRTSIIGPELNSQFGLLEWARSQKDKTVNGFTNHFWNGLTTLEFANVCHQIIESDRMYVHGTRHIFSTSLSKHDILCSLNEKYDLNLNIIPTECHTPVNRTLSTIYDLNQKLKIISFDQMIDEL